MEKLSTTSDNVLQAQSRSLWGKTGKDHDDLDLWLPLVEHLDDTMSVAGYLWERWVAGPVKRRLIVELGTESSAFHFFIFLAGVHDIGKATPAFASAPGVPNLRRSRIRESGLRLPEVLADRAKLHHSLSGHIIVSDGLFRRGMPRRSADEVAVIIGGHHGVPPKLSSVHLGGHDSHLMGGPEWQRVQEWILQRMIVESEAWEPMSRLGRSGLSQPAQVLLSGLVILADWLASNLDFFPLLPSDSENVMRPSRNKTAFQRIGFPASWAPRHPVGDVGERLRDRFAMPESVEPRPVQVASVEVAKELRGSGIMVIEAPMGEGKTEAALLAAEILAADVAASGLLFALPTQATSDAVFERVLRWLEKMPSNFDESVHTISLLHGRAGLSKAWGELPLSRGVEGVGVDDDTSEGTFLQMYVDPWTRGSKRAVLADFGVGTIDQLLFLALRTRHLALRHLGIASKVVVIDEVHAYDAYMDMYLTRALEWLGSYGVPVILLSATLTEKLRSRLIGAYLSEFVGDPTHLVRSIPAMEMTSQDSDYPLVVRASGTGVIALPVEPSARHIDVEVRRLFQVGDELDAICTLLEEVLHEGGCALVIRNTVARAIEAATILRERLSFEVRLIHSRFTSDDRLSKETQLRSDFGAGRSAMVGKPIVVISTQVIEQSLDVDFDVLVSDVAPLDLILQRIGRLHRHRETLPSESRCTLVRPPTIWLTGMRDWEHVPPSPDKGSESVYGLYPLIQALAVLGLPEISSTVIRIPGDVRSLVERAYGDVEEGPKSWAQGLAAARVVQSQRLAAAEERARSFRVSAPARKPRAILGWLDGAADDGDDSVAGQRQVRDAEASVEVILLSGNDQQNYRAPTNTSGNRRFQLDELPNDDEVRALIGCTVRLPAWVVDGKFGDALIAEMERRWYPAAWQNSPTLRGRLVMVMDENGRQQCNGLEFSYDSERGLEVTRVD